MKLNTQGLREVKLWEKAGYALPQFDREKVTEATKENPFWVHFGAGNLFRAFQANVVQKLLNEGILDRGLVVAEGYDYEIVEKMNHPHDDYSILVTLKADGTVEKTVVGSVVESLTVDSGNEADFGRLKEIFTKDSLQMVTFTITEKGYFFRRWKQTLRQDRKNQRVILVRWQRFCMHDSSQGGSPLPWSVWTIVLIMERNCTQQSGHLQKNGRKMEKQIPAS